MSRDEEIFAGVHALPAAERAAYIDQQCAENPALRAEILELLAGYAEMERVQPAALDPGPLAGPEEKSGDRIGRYRLQEKIGEGGCGVVWRAEQTEPVRRRVALKVIKLGMDTKEVIARFEAERQALALMDHPNIARIFDAGATDTGRPYFVMEFVPGIPITRYCDEAKLNLAQRLQLFIPVCQAIEHAHQKRIVHRDIKPSNILVASHEHPSPGEPIPKVIDFGVAKATQGRLTDATLFTAFTHFIGTPAYMSPEQAEFSGIEVDTRSDIYSLGVVLYELLTGRPPFDPKTLQESGLDETRRIIREVDPPRPSTRLGTLNADDRATLARRRGAAPAQLSQQLSGDLDWIVMHCLEKDRTRRYASANDLALDLHRHLRHEPVLARPPRASYRLGKFIRRHRLSFATAAVASLALALGATMSIRQSLRADRAERLAAGLKSPLSELNPKSIAVLPFENLSEDKEANAFFVDGMHEDVIANLTRIAELRCMPRSTSVAYQDTKKSLREIAGELQVAYVLNGSVRRAGQQVRLTGTLMDARTMKAVWSRTYDRNLTDLFAIQAEVAQSIAAELKTVLSPETRELLQRRPTENLAAYDLFLKSREIRNRGLVGYKPPSNAFREGSFLQVQESLLQSALTLDPNFAAAWAGLAWIHCSTYHGFETTLKDRSDIRRNNAKAAIERAIELAPDDPEVMLSHGYYLQFCERDYTRATAAFSRIALLQPNTPAPHLALGQLQRAQGKWTEALASFRQATALDPGSILAGTELVVLLGSGRRWEEKRHELQRLLALSPNNLTFTTHLIRLPYYATGDTRDMEAFAKEEQYFLFRAAHQHEKFVPLLAKFPAPPPPASSMAGSWVGNLHYAVILAAHGNVAEARRRIENAPANLRARLALDPDNTTLLCDLACIEAVLGHQEEAVRTVSRAMELTPLETDRWHAPQVMENLAFVYAWTGDKTRAIETYAQLLQTVWVSPRVASNSVHVMRHSLWFSPLRGDPRWEALLADPKNQAPLF